MSQFKKKLSAFTAMLALLTITSSAAFAMPGTVLGQTGNTGITDVGGGRTNVDIVSGKNGDVGQVDWHSFNVGAGEHVNFGFSGLSQTIINRVLGGQASNILGKMTSSCVAGGTCDSFGATGKVILINPAGIMFGAGSQVDLNSFTASTYDIRGAKNLNGLSKAEIEAYQNGVLNKMSALGSVNGTGKDVGSITFDSHYQDAFQKAGIEYKPGETRITMNGATFAHWDDNGQMTDYNPNKSLAFVSDNIDYKDSLIRTGSNLNYTTPNSSGSFSNVRMITGDGVTFDYLANGYVDNYKVAEDKSGVERQITIDNTKLTDNKQVGIQSGNVRIINQSTNKNSDIKIKNAIIKGTKLVNTENGDIMIAAQSGSVDIDNSRLSTVNTSIEKDGHTYDTTQQRGGEIAITAGKDVNVKDSLMITSGSKAGTQKDTNSGSIRVYSYNGNETIENSDLLADGNVDLAAYGTTKDAGKVTTKGSLIQARNTTDPSLLKNVEISGNNGVDIHNTIVDASKDIKITAADNNVLSGDINITSDKDAEGHNQTFLLAGDKLSIQGKNTKLDNATSAYKTIKFYNDGTTGTNNVTVANDSTFAQLVNKEDGKLAIGSDITLETNGDFTLDHATMQRGSYNLTFERNGDQTLKDDGSVKGVKHHMTTKTTDVGTLNVKSTQGNVTAKNGTNVNAKTDINLDGAKNTTVQDSTLKAGRDVKVLARGNDATVKSSTIEAGQDVNIEATNASVKMAKSNITGNRNVNVKSKNTIKFGNQDTDNIKNDVNMVAGEDMNITSTGADIVAEKTTMPTLKYGDRLTFNAKGSNRFTSQDSMKMVNVDFVAGEENNITTKGDMQFVNSSLKAPKNNIQTTQEGGDIIMNNLTIKSATTNPEDTKTTITAKGNVTTKDVTGTAQSDVAQAQKTFPQSVNYDGKVTDKSTPDTVLDVNHTKLTVHTNVQKTEPRNNDNGSITLKLKNADNRKAGVDIVAENNTWDEQIGAGEGPEVHLSTADGNLSITNIDTDKLTLNEGDHFIAGSDTKDGGAPTIRVKDQGGFNMDPNKGYEPGPNGFGYDQNWGEKDKTVTQERVWDEEGEYIVEQKDNETTYGKDYVDRTTTTVTETDHNIHFNENGDEEFHLVYDKTTTDVEETPGTEYRTEQICPEKPDVDRTDDDIDSLINQVKLPREQVEISKTSKVSDNTVDQTSSIMSAAAKVDLSGDVEADFDDEDDEQ